LIASFDTFLENKVEIRKNNFLNLAILYFKLLFIGAPLTLSDFDKRTWVVLLGHKFGIDSNKSRSSRTLIDYEKYQYIARLWPNSP
jgi:hypothetical protein